MLNGTPITSLLEHLLEVLTHSIACLSDVRPHRVVSRHIATELEPRSTHILRGIPTTIVVKPIS
jgi:hypothetical protein